MRHYNLVTSRLLQQGIGNKRQERPRIQNIECSVHIIVDCEPFPLYW